MPEFKRSSGANWRLFKNPVQASDQEKYNKYYDDSSSDEEEEAAIEKSSLEKIKGAIKRLGEAEELKEVAPENLKLSFLAHEFGLRILASAEVRHDYRGVKDQYLINKQVLTDDEIRKILSLAFKKSIEKTFNPEEKKLIRMPHNAEKWDKFCESILQEKRVFIKSIRDKECVDRFPTDFKFPKLPFKSQDALFRHLNALLQQIHAEIGIKSPKKTVNKKNPNANTALRKYRDADPLKCKLAEKLRGVDKKIEIERFLADFIESCLQDGRIIQQEEQYRICDEAAHVFKSTLQSELLTALAISQKNVRRQTLPRNFSFQADHPRQVFAHIRLMNVSNRRLIKNFEDPGLCDYEVLIRSFDFLNLEDKDQYEGREFQKIFTKTGTRSDSVEIGNKGSYAAIAAMVEKIKTALNIKDADIAQCLVEVLQGQGKQSLRRLTRELNENNRQYLKKFINALTYLMFSTEVSRNPASLIINRMILDLIIESKLSWRDVFCRQKMPMAIQGAVNLSRWMHANYETTVRYHYDKSSMNTLNQKALAEMIAQEAQIVRSWLALNGKDKEENFRKVFVDLASQCSAWYGVSVLPKYFFLLPESVRIENHRIDGLLKALVM